MTNKYLSKISSFNFKQYSTNQEEKRRILKLCKRKLKVLKQTDNISVKSVLIRNTLRVMERQNDALLDFEDTSDDGHNTPDSIETLLNEIDLDNCKSRRLTSSMTLPTLDQKSAVNSSSSNLHFSEVLEEFHNCETFSQNKLVFSEDPHNIFLEISSFDEVLRRSQSF